MSYETPFKGPPVGGKVNHLKNLTPKLNVPDSSISSLKCESSLPKNQIKNYKTASAQTIPSILRALPQNQIQNRLISATQTHDFELVSSPGKLPFINFGLNGNVCVFLIDTGSPVSILGSTFKHLVTRREESSFQAVNSSPIVIYGMTHQCLQLGDMSLPFDFYVADVNLNLLGNDFFKQYHATIDYRREIFSIGHQLFPLYPNVPQGINTIVPSIISNVATFGTQFPRTSIILERSRIQRCNIAPTTTEKSPIVNAVREYSYYPRTSANIAATPITTTNTSPCCSCNAPISFPVRPASPRLCEGARPSNITPPRYPSTPLSNANTANVLHVLPTNEISRWQPTPTGYSNDKPRCNTTKSVNLACVNRFDSLDDECEYRTDSSELNNNNHDTLHANCNRYSEEISTKPKCVNSIVVNDHHDKLDTHSGKVTLVTDTISSGDVPSLAHVREGRNSNTLKLFDILGGHEQVDQHNHFRPVNPVGLVRDVSLENDKGTHFKMNYVKFADYNIINAVSERDLSAFDDIKRHYQSMGDLYTEEFQSHSPKNVGAVINSLSSDLTCKLNQIKDKYPEVFKEVLNLRGETSVSLEINLEGQYRVPYCYQVPNAYRDKAEAKINEMLESGIIRPSSSPYQSPLVCVPKKHRLLYIYSSLCKKGW